MLSLLLLLFLAAAPGLAASPRLGIFTMAPADVLPGQAVTVVITLHSDTDAVDARLSHTAPPGLLLVSTSASTGSLAVFDMYPPGAPPAGVLWSGVVSPTQPLSIAIRYQVLSDTPAGDLVLSVTGQVGAEQVAASTMVRVCCAEWPPPAWPGSRRYLPIVLH